jgi:hypothetical protein
MATHRSRGFAGQQFKSHSQRRPSLFLQLGLELGDPVRYDGATVIHDRKSYHVTMDGCPVAFSPPLHRQGAFASWRRQFDQVGMQENGTLRQQMPKSP